MKTNVSEKKEFADKIEKLGDNIYESLSENSPLKYLKIEFGEN